MHYSALSARSQVLRRNQNTTRYQPLVQGLGPISNALLVSMMVAVLGMIYLTQITKTSSFGYQVETLKNTKAALIEENASLEGEAARLQALERVRQSDVAKSLEAAGDIQYAQ